MTAQAISLPDYGAPELKAYAGRSMTAGAAGSTLLMLTAVLLTLLVMHVVHRLPAERTGGRVVLDHFPQAPPLSPVPPTPVRLAAPKMAPPSTGIPVPAPDAATPSENTLATPRELADQGTGVTPGPADQIVINRPPEPEQPPARDWQHYEEEPKLVGAEPVYPDIARQAGIEGQVTLKLLVGLDGKVTDVAVVSGVAVLNDAAIRAARQFLFRPALSGGQPVAVWVAVPFRFRLDGR